MEVDEGGFQTTVTEVSRELMKGNAAFEHVGGVGMAQGMTGDLVVFFGEPAFGRGDSNGGPDAGLGHGVIGVMHGLAQGDTGGFPSPSGSRKEPVGIAMVFPKET